MVAASIARARDGKQETARRPTISIDPAKGRIDSRGGLWYERAAAASG